MATLSIETREKYSIEIEEELYNKYLNGELTKEEVLDKTGDEIVFSCGKSDATQGELATDSHLVDTSVLELTHHLALQFIKP